MTIAFVTFGCRLNRAESLDLEAQYAAAGWEIVQLAASADRIDDGHRDSPDVVVVRGCSVTAKAQRDCDKKIVQIRSRFPNAEIVVLGRGLTVGKGVTVSEGQKHENDILA